MIIKTKLFTLRPFEKRDEASLVKNINNEKIYKPTLNIPYPYTAEDARIWIERNEKYAEEKPLKAVNFAIDINGEVIGGIGITKIEKGEGELGYWLGEDYWGKGFMSEAVREVTYAGFKKLKLKRIYADVFLSNKVSARVLEKNGYILEEVMQGRAIKDGKEIDNYRFAKVID
ncbi:MAG: GNAT family N-acetyltransferase [Patescibacteria group bacterium]